MDALVKISEAAEYVGLPQKTIRYYEDVGLVSPLRAENGFRQFRSSDLRALKIIKNARNLGFSIEDSRALLDLFMNKKRSSADVKKLATKHLEETQCKLKKLARLCAQLEHLTTSCRDDDMPDCAILDFLADLR